MRFGRVALGWILLGSVVWVSPAHASEPLVPFGFKVPASNGYTLSVIAFDNPRTVLDGAYLYMRSRHAGAVYVVPAVVGPTSIHAEFGALGRIDVDFVSSNRSRVEYLPCGGKAVQVDSGRYEGSIDFEGEEGYSEVHVSSARGEVKQWLSLVCSESGTSEGIGGHSPGARLTVKAQGANGFEFTVMKNSPIRPAMFAVSTSERQGSLFISREIGIRASPGAFEFDVPAGTARIRPPAPFTGEASYRCTAGKSVVWKGNLSVDLPGRADVSLTGRGVRASLIRAVLNPGHVFRAP